MFKKPEIMQSRPRERERRKVYFCSLLFPFLILMKNKQEKATALKEILREGRRERVKCYENKTNT